MSATRPIASAEAVAALRAAWAMDPDPAASNPDYLARAFVTGGYSFLLSLPRRLVKALTERIAPGGGGYLLARTRFMDEHLKRALHQGVEQVVILGAGYDTRAHRFAAELGSRKVFEVDLPSTQQEKLRRLRRASVPEAANAVYVAHDFVQGDLRRTLERAGFDAALRTFFIWEGVSYYLKPPAVRETVLLLAGCRGGSTLAFDYALRSFVEGDFSTYGGKRVRRWLDKRGEPFHFGLAAGELGPYLEDLDLSVVEDIGPSHMVERYLETEDGRRLGRPYEHLRLALIATSERAA